MVITRYYHLKVNMANGQIEISKYDTQTEKQDIDDFTEMHEKFANEFPNTDVIMHRLMSEEALEEMRQEIGQTLREI